MPRKAQVAAPTVHIHFETRRDRPQVFAITPELVAAAAKRNPLPVETQTTIGRDLEDLSPLAGATALVTSNDVLTDARFPRLRLTEAAPRLRWIHTTFAGVEPLLPLDWLPKDVTLTNNSGVHGPKVEEFATMALLMLNAGIPRMVTQQTQREWRQIFTPTIEGKTVAVVGLGAMGVAVARAAKRLGLKVLGIRASVRPHRSADEVLGTSRLLDAMQRADFIFVTTPLTPQTRHLIGRDALAAMRPGAGIVNVGRAGVVDYDALRDALESGAVGGAVLDVFDPEPLPASSPLWHTPNLMVIPHCSSDDLERYVPRTLDLVFRNMARLIAGRRLENIVDRRSGY
jgi:phosphoglycerate dehydrogenase-like enzyme